MSDLSDLSGAIAVAAAEAVAATVAVLRRRLIDVRFAAAAAAVDCNT
ncbi:hypothetical protein [Defluviicoccus vanus]|uniref:Uncharacterized protein n=1 Tax=Defluviicoccus vanus TaxID=111831 RepID=A0A7H1MXD5_9PROT|nr:hypothetical protein [Defluviicoccus vanus]QNT68121.1 hypothetical protein HQ394_00545 [Defluviicoccus vanus]